MPDNPRFPSNHALPSPLPTLAVNNKPVAVPSGPLRSSTLHAAGLPRLYDPGFATTAAYTSSITFINGAKGVLRHRGYAIEDLARDVSFHELSHLLLFSTLPTQRQLAAWQTALAREQVPADVVSVVTAFSRAAHPMSVLIAALSALSSTRNDLNPAIAGSAVYASPATRRKAITTSLGLFPAIAAGVYRHHKGLHPAFLPQPQDSSLTHAQRFLQLASGSVPDKRIAHALETLLILHADHEMNCSTATVRQLSSSGVDVFSALCGGVAALYGPLHGGACESVLHMLVRIGDPSRVGRFLEGVKRREERLMGFGHRVYKNYDPRARIVRNLAYEIFSLIGTKDPLIEIATALEKAALADDYFVARKLYPNVDFYSGVIYKAMGFEPAFYPVLFALGRSAGWIAHWYEFLDDPDRRIARPHQRFVGVIGPRRVPRIDQREKGNGFEDGTPTAGGLVAKL